jgi:hypothetical protein
VHRPRSGSLGQLTLVLRHDRPGEANIARRASEERTRSQREVYRLKQQTADQPLPVASDEAGPGIAGTQETALFEVSSERHKTETLAKIRNHDFVLDQSAIAAAKPVRG